jgi:hypothetical protein
MYRHEAQTTASLSNSKFATSIPGVERKRYNSYGSEIIFVCYLMLRSVSFPHMEFKQILAMPGLAEFGFIAALSSLTPSVSKNVSM